MKVELLWWNGCPSTERALAELRGVLAEEGEDPDAIELREVTTDAEAEGERFTGSPTVRIEGREVAPDDDESLGLACRVYRLRDGQTSPVPDREDVRAVLREVRG